MGGKKILFHVPYLGSGGVTVALGNVIGALENAGFQCKIILPEKRFLRDKTLFDIIPQRYVEAYAWGSQRRRNGIVAGLIKLFNICTRWHFFFRDVPKVPHDVFVVYHVLGSEQWVNYTNRPTIGWLHGMIWTRKGLGTLISKLVHKVELNRFNKLIAISSHVSATWDGAYRLRAAPEVLPNIINIDNILNKGNEPQDEMSPANGRRQLLFVGRMSREKGLLRLLKCLMRVEQVDGVKFDLWVVGIGGLYTEESDINTYLDQHQNIKQCVHFLGYKSNPYPYMKTADLLIVPSYEEGFGLVIWESLLMHCPVLATDAGGCAEALRHGAWGLLVNNEDQALYEGLRTYFQNPASANPQYDFTTIEREIKGVNEESKRRLVDIFNKLTIEANETTNAGETNASRLRLS